MDGLAQNIQTLMAARVSPEVVIWADQNAPRPASPFWTIRRNTRRGIGQDYASQRVDFDGNQAVLGIREEVLEVQRFGDGAIDAVAELRDTIKLESVRGEWRRLGLTVGTASNALNVPYLVDGGSYEPRATIDLTLRYAVFRADNVGIIDTVGISGAMQALCQSAPFGFISPIPCYIHDPRQGEALWLRLMTSQM